MKLVLLTFGDRIENHYQAVFSILSFLREPMITGVYVVTDKPNYYRHLEQRAEVIEVDKTLLQQWRGQHDFFWRIKIKAIEAVIQLCPNEDILYVDSDTCYIKNLDNIASGLQQGQTFMHEAEGRLSELDSNEERRMWQSLQNKTFGGVDINQQTEMWNAGVIALPGSHSDKIIQHTLAICDAICATPCPRRLVEQFSFSLALNAHKSLVNCQQSILHYWGNKPQWNVLIESFFVYAHLHDETIADESPVYN